MVDRETGYRAHFEDSDAVYAEFNRNGHVSCYNESTLTYFAEVPCDTVNDGRFSFTKEMCERKVDLENCLDFYRELSEPTYRPVLRCGIGAICHHKYTTSFASPTECPSEYKRYQVFPSRLMENGNYRAISIREYFQLEREKSDKLFHSGYDEPF